MELIAKIIGMNTSDGMYNVVVRDALNNQYNLKVSADNVCELKIGHTYTFTYDVYDGIERSSNVVRSLEEVTNMPFEQQNETLRMFYPQAPISAEEAIKEVYSYINKIDNKVIKDITKTLIDRNKDLFFIYPAASKLHHAYVGGLAYHSIGMVHFADGFIENYPYLNKDYIYAGILLHDIGKTIELTGVVNTEYTIKGQLLGHLVLGAMAIEDVSKELGYENTEEVMILEHMLISHHGQPQFGSAKKPMTAEALVLWYIDTIDSKFRVLGEELEKTKPGEFTDNIGVLDRMKIYKAK